MKVFKVVVIGAGISGLSFVNFSKNNSDILIISLLGTFYSLEKNYDKAIYFQKKAIENVQPQIETRSRRVGGATYQVPVEVKSKRAQALAIRWLVDSARKRNEKSMMRKLAAEIFDASENKGAAMKKREETLKMAEANKAFSHFSW